MMMQAILQEYAGERDAAGLLHGQGRAEFISGQVYDGDWQHGRMQGHGSIWSPDGIRWTGSFVSANTISGSGVSTQQRERVKIY